MITPEYCVTMARYNAWQNKGLRTLVEAMGEDDLRKDRGAFFGSIFATLNHLLWGDMLWMSRFDGGEGPDGGIGDSVDLTPKAREWSRLRFLTDGRIREWALSLDAVDLVGDLSWYSGALQRDVKKPLAFCIAHFFNHQTHHRGQVHAMMTAAGQRPDDTDLFIMPDA
ncbi:MAG: DinB family protein [Pseudomonadota bacterium]